MIACLYNLILVLFRSYCNLIICNTHIQNTIVTQTSTYVRHLNISILVLPKYQQSIVTWIPAPIVMQISNIPLLLGYQHIIVPNYQHPTIAKILACYISIQSPLQTSGCPEAILILVTLLCIHNKSLYVYITNSNT